MSNMIRNIVQKKFWLAKFSENICENIFLVWFELKFENSYKTGFLTLRVASDIWTWILMVLRVGIKVDL